MHSCPVSSFSGRSLLTPSSSVPFALCVPLSLSLFLVAPQHPPHLQHGYPPSSFRSRLAYLTAVLSPSSLSTRPYQSSSLSFFPLLFLLHIPLARLPVVHPRRLLSYYFVGARGWQVYLSFYMVYPSVPPFFLSRSFSFTLSSFLFPCLAVPRSPHINIAALSERFIAEGSLLAEGPRPGSPRRRRRTGAAVRLSRPPDRRDHGSFGLRFSDLSPPLLRSLSFCRRLPVPPMPITMFALAHSCLCLGAAWRARFPPNSRDDRRS